MSAVPKRKLTPAEYLAIEKAAAVKSEFFAGEMFAMAGASRAHNELKDALIAALRTAFRGGPCRTYSSDQRVRVDATGLYTYPDIVILCGPAETAADDPDTLTNPTALVEVLSASTERYDRTTKFRHYQQIPSLREYVLVAQDEPVIERFVRQPDGAWAVVAFVGPGAVLELVSVPVRVPLADVYAGVEFTGPPPTV